MHSRKCNSHIRIAHYNMISGQCNNAVGVKLKIK